MANSGTSTVLTIVDHNLRPSDFVLVENSSTNLDDRIFQIIAIDTANNTVTLADINLIGSYNGGGTVARVSVINIVSKQWNPYVDQSRNVYIQRIDFCVLKTVDGQVTVDYYPSASNQSMINAGIATGSIMGNNILETSPYSAVFAPLEQFQKRLWHPIYFQTDGEFIQIQLYLSKTQMLDKLIALEDFELEAMILWTQPTTARLQ